MSNLLVLKKMYEDLAIFNDQRKDHRQRDIFLILAADTALSAGMRDEAERLRALLMQLTPHNLLRPFPTFIDALRSPDIQDYISDLRAQFPPEKAEGLLRSQGMQLPSPGDIPVYKLSDSSPKPAYQSSHSKTMSQTGNRKPVSKSPYEPVQNNAVPPIPEEEIGGSWVATLLFILVFLGGVALAGYTLSRPFW